ncbi:uncharacterized protein LOC108681117 [Hyalella azteca]|uniref:Uncharacterized protein LOC108681117 n=1 Tax=Hyalella azteca TaxID=294128 RepID=A0A8B7PHG0_HYAAZ|nr:uncharacterized protein LOC108681117 [Hyalella azteca]
MSSPLGSLEVLSEVDLDEFELLGGESPELDDEDGWLIVSSSTPPTEDDIFDRFSDEEFDVELKPFAVNIELIKTNQDNRGNDRENNQDQINPGIVEENEINDTGCSEVSIFGNEEIISFVDGHFDAGTLDTQTEDETFTELRQQREFDEVLLNFSADESFASEDCEITMESLIDVAFEIETGHSFKDLGMSGPEKCVSDQEQEGVLLANGLSCGSDKSYSTSQDLGDDLNTVDEVDELCWDSLTDIAFGDDKFFLVSRPVSCGGKTKEDEMACKNAWKLKTGNDERKDNLVQNIECDLRENIFLSKKHTRRRKRLRRWAEKKSFTKFPRSAITDNVCANETTSFENVRGIPDCTTLMLSSIFEERNLVSEPCNNNISEGVTVVSSEEMAHTSCTLEHKNCTLEHKNCTLEHKNCTLENENYCLDFSHEQNGHEEILNKEQDRQESQDIPDMDGDRAQELEDRKEEEENLEEYFSELCGYDLPYDHPPDDFSTRKIDFFGSRLRKKFCRDLMKKRGCSWRVCYYHY